MPDRTSPPNVPSWGWGRVTGAGLWAWDGQGCPPRGAQRDPSWGERELLYLQRSEHAAGDQDQQPEIQVEEVGDLVGHEARENQQEEAHADAAEMLPGAPRGGTAQRGRAHPGSNTHLPGTPRSSLLLQHRFCPKTGSEDLRWREHVVARDPAWLFPTTGRGEPRCSSLLPPSTGDRILLLFLPPVPVAGGPQRQHDGISYLNHGLQCGGHHDEEDDAEEEGPLEDLQVEQPRLQRQQQQRHTLRHPPARSGA